MENQKRKAVLVLIYASDQGTRTGRRYPVGKHLRAEVRAEVTGEVLAKHAYSPYSTQRLNSRFGKRFSNTSIVAQTWEVEKPAAENDAAEGKTNAR